MYASVGYSNLSNNLEFVTSEKLKGDKEIALMALHRRNKCVPVPHNRSSK
jgi:hypothetical protein